VKPRPEIETIIVPGTKFLKPSGPYQV
jgi:hypothetical protein